MRLGDFGFASFCECEKEGLDREGWFARTFARVTGCARSNDIVQGMRTAFGQRSDVILC